MGTGKLGYLEYRPRSEDEIFKLLQMLSICKLCFEEKHSSPQSRETMELLLHWNLVKAVESERYNKHTRVDCSCETKLVLSEAGSRWRDDLARDRFLDWALSYHLQNSDDSLTISRDEYGSWNVELKHKNSSRTVLAGTFAGACDVLMLPRRWLNRKHEVEKKRK